MKKTILLFTALMLLAFAGSAFAQAITDTFCAVEARCGYICGAGTGFEPPGFPYPPWVEYPSGWVNQWFYDHPLDWTRGKIIHIEFDLRAFNTEYPSEFVFAVNWSTPDWSYLGFGQTWPPIPDVPGAPFDEELYIERVPLLGDPACPMIDLPAEYTHYEFEWIVYDYNPEWVSIDIMGENFDLANGVIIHECVDKSVDTKDETWGAIKSMLK